MTRFAHYIWEFPNYLYHCLGFTYANTSRSQFFIMDDFGTAVFSNILIDLDGE